MWHVNAIQLILLGRSFSHLISTVSSIYGYPSFHTALGFGYGGRAGQEMQCLPILYLVVEQEGGYASGGLFWQHSSLA